MLQKILNSRITYAICSILLAIGIWSYVVFESKQDEVHTIRSIPITFEGESVLAERGLIITSVTPRTVDLELTGNPRSFIGVTRESITIAPIVSNITTPGEQVLLYEPSITAQYGNLTVTGRSANYITVQVERLVTRTIELRPVVTANAADGYQMGEMSYTPSTIEIKGPSNEVNQVSHAEILVEGDNLTATTVQDLPFKLVGYQDEELTDLNVSANVDVISVTLPVVVLKEVPLKVNFINGGGATEENISYEISPATIFVSGSEADMAALDYLVIGEVDLSTIINPETLNFTIELDSELSNESGITKATVTVAIEGLVTRGIDVTDIRITNAPEGFETTVVTQSKRVMIRGTQEQIDAVQDHQIWLVADLSNIAAAEGTSSVRAKAYLNNGNGAGVVDIYYVLVSLSR